jgi:hypothetical protein
MTGGTDGGGDGGMKPAAGGGCSYAGGYPPIGTLLLLALLAIACLRTRRAA